MPITLLQIDYDTDDGRSTNTESIVRFCILSNNSIDGFTFAAGGTCSLTCPAYLHLINFLHKVDLFTVLEHYIVAFNK